MIPNKDLERLKRIIIKEKKAIDELGKSFYVRVQTPKERDMLLSYRRDLKLFLRKINQTFGKTLYNLSLFRPLTQTIEFKPEIKVERALEKKIEKKGEEIQKYISPKISGLEKETLKRLKIKEKKKIVKRKDKPSMYVSFANRLFAKMAADLSSEPFFRSVKRDLVRTNLRYLFTTYLALALFTTLISFIASIFVFVFFLFFNLGANPPFITMMQEGILQRTLKTFWVLFLIPFATFIFMYFYPSMEKKSLESKINQELPFATIHMAAISGSMVEPSKIFSIIISTKEYPAVEKELIKLINEINVYGKDLVTALKVTSFNSPSTRFSELLNGLATTINSGGDLPEFFEKRSQSLLFEHRLEKEKIAKSSETFMDIYISVVVAAPMILMLLLILMKISGLGFSLSTGMISLIMVLSVSIINIVFLTFLYLKQPNE